MCSAIYMMIYVALTETHRLAGMINVKQEFLQMDIKYILHQQ